MVRRRALLSMLIAMMVGFYALGASRGAWACVAFECSACASPNSDCKHATSNADCAPACAVVVPATSKLSIPALPYADVSIEIVPFAVALHPGPEPPPPRLA